MSIFKRETYVKTGEEFRKFLARGNMIDLAVGIVVGGAFRNIVNSLVNDIVMPPIGLVLGRVNFSDLYVNLSNTHYDSLSAAQAAGAPTINYGTFINTVIDFIITAAVIFLLVREINSVREATKKKEAAPPPAPTTKKCPHCFTEIPIEATRCPNCTSHLDVPAAAPA